jgi:hypothetical protein
LIIPNINFSNSSEILVLIYNFFFDLNSIKIWILNFNSTKCNLGVCKVFLNTLTVKMEEKYSKKKSLKKFFIRNIEDFYLAYINKILV